jgi:translin
MKPEPTEELSLDEIVARLRATLESTNRAREEALRASREVIQFSSRTIRAVHRGEMEAAQTLANEARERVEAVKTLLRDHPEIYFAGYVHDSQKEYVEARSMLAIVSGAPLPSPETLGIEPPAYLNGIAEAASESRRYVLDRLREGQIERADAILKVMDDIYYELITFDFPDAITGGLRRTTDALRAVLERTRGDLTLTLSQKRLETALLRAESIASDSAPTLP